MAAPRVEATGSNVSEPLAKLVILLAAADFRSNSFLTNHAGILNTTLGPAWATVADDVANFEYTKALEILEQARPSM